MRQRSTLRSLDASYMRASYVATYEATCSDSGSSWPALWGRVVAAEVAEVLGLQSPSDGNPNTRSNLLAHADAC